MDSSQSVACGQVPSLRSLLFRVSRFLRLFRLLKDSVDGGICYYSTMKDKLQPLITLPKTEIEILTQVQLRINESLAPMLRDQVRLEKYLDASQIKYDAILTVVRASGQNDKFVVEAKSQVNMRDVWRIIESLTKNSDQLNEYAGGMLAARYLSKSIQKVLKQNGISYADATGNFMITSPSTGLFVLSDAGAKSDPWRTRGRPTNSLKGNAPARVIRALLDEKLPLTMTELINKSNSSTSVVYRVIGYLEDERLLQRKNKVITNVKFKELVERWSEEYSFSGINTVTLYLSPRGIDDALNQLKNIQGIEYAITGSVAAARYASYAEAKQLSIYAKYPLELAKKLNLRPVVTGANVMIATNAFDVVFKGTMVDDGLTYVAPSQIVVDLLSGPGRNPAEAEFLIDWILKDAE